MSLEKEMKKLIKLLQIFDKRKINVNVYTSTDEAKISLGFGIQYAARIDKEKYPVRFFYEHQKHPRYEMNLNIDFCSFKSDKNYIIIEKDKILSEKLLTIKFFVNDYRKIHESYDRILSPWFDKRKRKETGTI